jgi:hypothetical protein
MATVREGVMKKKSDLQAIKERLKSLVNSMVST